MGGNDGAEGSHFELPTHIPRLCLGGCGAWGAEGPVVEVHMKGPMAVAVDADGNLHVADKHNH